MTETKPTHREAYDHQPDRKTPDFCVEQLKTYANTPRTREDSRKVNCATFGAMDQACRIITQVSKIPATKVYPGLREIGYTVRYADMKAHNPDALWELAEITDKCMDMLDPGLMPYLASSNGLFEETHTVAYRINESSIEVAKKDALSAGVKISELNLFNALSGLELLTQTDPNYALLLNHLYISECLSKLDFIRRRLDAKRSTLLKVLR